MAQIKISHDEFARLIRVAAQEHKYISGALGGYIDSEESAWALPYIAEWRGITFSSGAGI